MDNTLIAVSGGADSMYLLHTMKNYKNVHVAHVNYNYRDDSSEDEALVKAYCEENRIPFHCKCVQSHGVSNFEAWAREVRYDFFTELMDKYNLGRLATAHHMGDQAETLMIRLERGTGVVGLGGIRSSDKMYRPLLDVTKEFIYSECSKHSIPFREDYTNADTKFARNWFRHNVLSDDTRSELSEIATIVHSIEDKLYPMLESMYDGLVWEEGGTVYIDKSVDADEFFFIHLSRILKPYILLNRKVFENIFSEDPSLNKFDITRSISCNKRKKRVIEIFVSQT